MNKSIDSVTATLDGAAHLGVDVEVPVALKVSLLALCIVEQEAVFDDEESTGRQ